MATTRDDWAQRIQTWASGAHTAPQPHDQHPPMNPHNPDHQTDARQGATDRAVDAGERLMDATTKIGNAYADAYQQAVINLADVRERLGQNTPADWQSLLGPQPTALHDPTELHEQLLQATKHLARTYLDAYEQTLLTTLDLHQHTSAANPYTTPTATHARDLTKTLLDHARKLLA